MLVALATLAVAGCSDPGPGAASTPTQAVSPGEFAAEVDGGQRFVLNVHTPDEGSIDGTDASIPVDQLGAREAELPADRGTPWGAKARPTPRQ